MYTVELWFIRVHFDCFNIYILYIYKYIYIYIWFIPLLSGFLSPSKRICLSNFWNFHHPNGTETRTLTTSQLQPQPPKVWNFRPLKVPFFSNFVGNGRYTRPPRLPPFWIHATTVYLPLFTYIWLIFKLNVGKYTSPMDPKWIITPLPS